MSLIESISSFVQGERKQYGEDLKYKFGDEICNIDDDGTPTIAYDYLYLDSGDKYSFLNPELNQNFSEEFPNESDYAIYFRKIKSFCKKTLNKSLYHSKKEEHIHIVNSNERLVDLLRKTAKTTFNHNNIPQFGQFALYTNVKDNRAPRVFFFIGNYAIVYILFYDPYHEITKMKEDINKRT